MAGGYSYNSTPLKDNEWSFVGIVVSSRNGTFYLNGNPDGTKTGILSSNYDDIGYHGDEAFKGGIDDLRFYNRALSDEEMKALYALTKTTKIGTPPTPSNLENGLVGHWTFDGPDVSSTTAFEKGGNISLNAFISSGVKPGIGKIGQGLLFSETDQTLIVPKTSAINNLNVVTYSFWAKVASNDMLSKFFWSYNPQTGSIFQTFSTGSEFWSANLAGAGLSVPLKDDTWYHHVITYDKTSASNNPTLYINGRKIVLTRLFNKTGTVVDDSTSDLKLVFLNTRGTVDDFRIYNRILSPKEVTQLYQLGAGSTIKICKEASVKDADGNDYNTLAIGSQCWLDRNMNVGTRISSVSNQTNNGTIEKYCYNDDSANCTTNHPNKPDGGLYQWDEAMQYSATEGAHGICPVGFHIPTHAEWLTLGKYLTTKYWGSAVQPGGNSGFEANRAGYGFSVSFFDRSSYSYFWTSSVSSSQARYLLFWTSVYTSFTYIKSNYLSVRCIQD